MSRLSRYWPVFPTIELPTILLPSFIYLVVAGASFPVSAQPNESLAINQSSCMKCHKRNGAMFGLHANTALAIQCQSCHGQRGKHPRKGSNIRRFTSDSATPATEQAGTCLECHDHETLAMADWTHNVHADKISCASCHQLHVEYDPILGITTKERSQLCRGCHLVK
ncbi:nitrite reductase [Shewanella canadensis]|uniref:Nitrite reductase n=1 Tax=Shewanella canadensis TaxID=271096 RepID=A0A3S0J848_9GAMM|nr:cytochrome c3 family protein [Shewanella canadensis]RTR39908.1 nitrite reductase [Shewanella canadensis]